MGLIEFKHSDIGMQDYLSYRYHQASAAATPRVKLLPVRLVNTFRPWPSSSSTTIFVVVVLPLVPLISTTPCGNVRKHGLIKFLSIVSTNRPGKADPPPRKSGRFADGFSKQCRKRFGGLSICLHYTVGGTKIRYNMDMIIVWALSWWYGAGWKARLLGLREQLASVRTIIFRSAYLLRPCLPRTGKYQPVR